MNANKDLCYAKDKFNIKEIADFRTEFEVGLAPDKEINGTNGIRISITDDEKMKRIDFANAKLKTGNFSTDALLAYYEYCGNALTMYSEIVNSELSHIGYRKFFDILLENDKGTLFHCASGKDRTGFAAICLLSALGVDRKTVLDDFEASNVYYDKKRKDIVSFLNEKGIDNKVISEVVGLIGVERSTMEELLKLIDENYGGMIEYLHNQIGLTDAEINKLCEKYLD